MRCRSMIFLFTLLVFPLYVTGSAVAADTKPDVQSKTGIEQEKMPLEASSLWIVVNLFTGRSSKQALIVKEKLQRLGVGGNGIVLPYREVTEENITRLRPAFLALSPNGIPWCRYKGRNREDLDNFFSALRVIVEKMEVPVVGICGGHQALAIAFGGKVGPIRGGEDDCFPYKNKPTERGRQNLQVIEKDPIFTGMGPTLNLVQNHFDEVKRLPPGFIHLARNDLSPLQIMKHPTKPAYGVQAHTEYWHASRPDGGTLLRNFLKIVAMHNRVARRPPAERIRHSVSDGQERPGPKEPSGKKPAGGA
jgi:GMP synthase (glutamine-hydrolysing)